MMRWRLIPSVDETLYDLERKSLQHETFDSLTAWDQDNNPKAFPPGHPAHRLSYPNAQGTICLQSFR
jgi:hypothetical protein